jgi:hypothetical protein
MTVPGDKNMTREEILAFTDTAGAALGVEGYLPSDHYDEESILAAYYAEREGKVVGADGMYQMITANPTFARLIMVADQVSSQYDNPSTGFDHDIDVLTGNADLGTNKALAAFMGMRMDVLAEQVDKWPDNGTKLAMFQLDAFLIGWCAAQQMRGDA